MISNDSGSMVMSGKPYELMTDVSTVIKAMHELFIKNGNKAIADELMLFVLERAKENLNLGEEVAK